MNCANVNSINTKVKIVEINCGYSQNKITNKKIVKSVWYYKKKMGSYEMEFFLIVS
jgi:hypothetical protein